MVDDVVFVNRQNQQPVKFCFQFLDFVLYYNGAGFPTFSGNTVYKSILQCHSQFFLLSMNQRTDGFQYSSVEDTFFKAGRIATGFRPELQPVDAPPDNLLSPVNVPCYPAEITSAVSTDQSFG